MNKIDGKLIKQMENEQNRWKMNKLDGKLTKQMENERSF